MVTQIILGVFKDISCMLTVGISYGVEFTSHFPAELSVYKSWSKFKVSGSIY